MWMDYQLKCIIDYAAYYISQVMFSKYKYTIIQELIQFSLLKLKRAKLL